MSRTEKNLSDNVPPLELDKAWIQSEFEIYFKKYNENTKLCPSILTREHMFGWGLLNDKLVLSFRIASVMSGLLLYIT